MGKNNTRSLILRLQKKDPRAEAEIVRSYNSRILFYFRSRIKGEIHYEDLVQEVFTSFFVGVKNEKIPEDVMIAPYLFGIAKRVIYNYFYKKKKQENIISKAGEMMELSYEFEEMDRLENQKIMESVNHIIDTFSDVDKIIIREFYLKENDVGHIAGLLGKTKHYVSVRKVRALKKIKNEILKRKDVYIDRE
jgi:RNA polymerase sigma factor (sigma-70 family)